MLKPLAVHVVNFTQARWYKAELHTSTLDFDTLALLLTAPGVIDDYLFLPGTNVELDPELVQYERLPIEVLEAMDCIFEHLAQDGQCVVETEEGTVAFSLISAEDALELVKDHEGAIALGLDD